MSVIWPLEALIMDVKTICVNCKVVLEKNHWARIDEAIIEKIDYRCTDRFEFETTREGWEDKENLRLIILKPSQVSDNEKWSQQRTLACYWVVLFSLLHKLPGCSHLLEKPGHEWVRHVTPTSQRTLKARWRASDGSVQMTLQNRQPPWFSEADPVRLQTVVTKK